MQNNGKNTLRPKNDSISTKLMSEQYGVTLYMVTPGSNTQIFTKNVPKYWYYANKFPIWTI